MNFFEQENKKNDNPKYEEIGGWLILLGIGLALDIIIGIYKFATVFIVPLFSSKSWFFVVLNDPSLQSKHSLLKMVFNFGMAFSFLALIISFVLIILFLSRKRWFVKLMLINLIFTVICILMYDFILYTYNFHEIMFDNFKSILQIVVYGGVWIPYLLISKRAKDTFIF